MDADRRSAPGTSSRVSGRPLLVDAAVAAAVGVAELVNLQREVVVTGYEPPVPAVAVAGWLLAMAALLVWRRRWPLAVLLVVGASAGLYALVDLPTLNLPGLVALFTASAALGASPLVAVGVGVVVAAVNLLRGTLSQLPIDLVVFGAVWLLGVNVHVRQLHARDLQRRRDAELWRVRSEERTRLARDLHDIVSNGVGGIYLQAVGAAGLVEDDPERARTALDAIQSSARSTLDELRTLLDVLRLDPGEGGEPGRGPTPSLAELDRLVERVRSTGAEVDADVAGDLTTLAPAVSTTGYRAVQEALGNAVRHGAGGPIRLRVVAADGGLRLDVVNDVGTGRGAAAATPPERTEGRWGLTGLRERVDALGGRLEVDSSGGAFRLTAELPAREAVR